MSLKHTLFDNCIRFRKESVCSSTLTHVDPLIIGIKSYGKLFVCNLLSYLVKPLAGAVDYYTFTAIVAKHATDKFTCKLRCEYYRTFKFAFYIFGYQTVLDIHNMSADCSKLDKRLIKIICADTCVIKACSVCTVACTDLD